MVVNNADIEIEVRDFAGTSRPVLLGVTERLEFADAPGHVADLGRYRTRGYAMKDNRIAIRLDRPMEIVEVHPPSVNSVEHDRRHGRVLPAAADPSRRKMIPRCSRSRSCSVSSGLPDPELVARKPGAPLQDCEVLAELVPLVPLLARRLAEDPGRDEPVHQCVRGRLAEPQQVRHVPRRHDRPLEERVREPDRARTADLVGEQPVHDRLPQGDDLLRGPLRLLRDLDHAPEEEREPVLVCPLGPDRVQERVVLRPVPLQEEGQVQQRPGEDPLPAEVERDQQPPDPAVAVEERVDRLELRVDQRDPDQRRDRVVRLDERLERDQGRPDLRGGRRDVDGLPDRGRSRRPE